MGSVRGSVILVRLAFAVGLGGTLFSTSCGEDIQNSIRSAGLSYVGSSATQVLQTFIPVKQLLSGINATN